MRKFWILVAVALLLLSGCAGKGLTTSEGASRAGPPGKLLLGRVTTDELIPLAGAMVELADDGLNTTTDPEGLFRFTGLEPRDYLVIVSHDGFESEARVAAMVLGRSFELNVILVGLPTGEPRHETSLFRGFLSCSIALRTDYPGWIDRDCLPADPNNRPAGRFEFDPHPSGLVIEPDWTATNACAERLRLRIALDLSPGPAETLADEEYLRSGTRIDIPPSYISQRWKTGGEVTSMFRASRCPDLPIGLALQQPVDLYFTAFYFEPIAPDFTALPG